MTIRPALALALSVALAPAAFAATPFDSQQKAAIEQIVRSYLVEHPEVLQDAMHALQAKQDRVAAESRKKAVAANHEKLVDSKYQAVIGNPNGDVTLVEFFDYNCPYCSRAHADIDALIKKDPKLRVVLKEFPVLGQGSVEAAKVAIAVNAVAPERYREFYDGLLGNKSGPIDGKRALAMAKQIGLPIDKITEAMRSPLPQKTVTEVYGLADKLGLTGTPSFVVGDNVLFGAVGLDALRQQIAMARCGAAAC